ncbi:MAG: DNA polymerase I [Bacteroidaceae bacterium]|nr:DNA polymerase I [Bacteroidaceae bacterium]
MPKLCLLDAYALIYRAYYALIRAPRINSHGENTSAVYGFVNTLDDVLRKEQPDYIAVAFDPPGGSFRNEVYTEYKAQREATPEDIRWAVPFIKRIVQAYRISLVEVAGYEADDVIGTLAAKGAAEGMQVVMVTPDKDYAQLVSPSVQMLRPGNGAKPWERLGESEVCSKYGFTSTRQMIDYLALVGDTADNIPGCPGVGPKTAQKLLEQFGSIDQLLERTAEIKGALRLKVENAVESIRLAQDLVTIRTDVPLPCAITDLKVSQPDNDALRQIYERLEFRSFLSKLSPAASQSQSAAVAQPASPSGMLDLFAPAPAEPAPQPIPSAAPEMGDLFAGVGEMPLPKPAETAIFPPVGTGNAENRVLADLKSTPHDYKLVENEAEARVLCAKLLTCGTVAFDTETTSTDALTAKLVGLSFATAPGTAWYVAVSLTDLEAARAMVEIFRPVYESTKILKVGQNVKYDLTVLASYGIWLAFPMFDTMLAHYVIQPELRHGMDSLAEAYLGYRTIHIDELIGEKGRGQRNMADLAPADLCDYACEDADVTLRLMQPLADEMERTGVRRVFDEVEMPLMPVLAQMERDGVYLDTRALDETGRLFKERMAALETEVYQLAGHPFNLASPRQVGEVLFGELKITDKVKRTKTGQYQTSEAVLESLKPKHPIVGKILAHRALKKLIGTYIDALPKLINPQTGRIHTSFNQAVTATGRLSSSNPNLQNIPVRGDDGKEIRKAFTAEPGCVFFSADYSQIELRLMAHLSGDANMIEAFRQGEDVHAATAAKIFKKPIADISRDERRQAKTANFGIIYGISAFGLAERMEVSRGEARELIDNYFRTFPGVRAFIDQAIEKARQQGYIETLFGRRRYLPDINSRNGTVRGYAERNAVNAPIQGTAADIIKLAMVRIARRMEEEKLQAKMVLQVHDELNFSVPAAELPRLRELVVHEMEHVLALSVPLVADCGQGANWLEAH